MLLPRLYQISTEKEMPEKVVLTGSERIEPQEAAVVGSVPDDETISASVVVRERPDGTHRRNELSASAGPGQPGLSDEEFADTYGADPPDIQAVVRFAEENGFTVDSASAPRRTVRITGTARQFQDVFGTTLRRYQHEGQTFRGRAGGLSVPADLASIVVGVLGIDNRPIGRRKSTPVAGKSPAQVAAAPNDSGSTSLTATQVATAYNFPSGVTGTGQTIAIAEFGGGYTASDLSSYFSGLGLSVPSVSDVSVDSATNSPGPASGSSDPTLEVTLDVELAGAVAQGASIVVYFAPNTSAGWFDAMQQIITDTTNNPSIISISWGAAEDGPVWTQQLITGLESSFAAAVVAKKITVFVASGDQGSSDGLTDGKAHVNYPASSPNVTGCGGTVLTLNGSAIATEVVWNNADGSSGGGISTVFPLPSSQSGAGVPASANPGGATGRGVPDVCGHADFYQIFVRGATGGAYGTSAVAPLWAGLTALINQQLGSNVGLLNPLIYQSSVASTFQDVTSGGNGAYSAGPGWDPCTGLGSPNGSALATALQAPATTSAAPAVTAISPASGSAAGGDSVTITGSGFTGATGGSFGTTAATNVQVGSDTQITATSPAGTGTVDVTVTTPAGTSTTSSADQFTYM
jgi:kumamolisin